MDANLTGRRKRTLRRKVVLAARGGMTQAEAARAHGLSLRAVQKACARAREGSLRALKGDARGRPAGHTLVSQAQQAKVRSIILGKLPNQLKLPFSFYLWTRQAVAQMAKRECGVDLSPTTVGRYLKDWAITARKPVRRAYERNDAAIAAWLAEQYRSIAKQAKREGARIYWGDARWDCAASRQRQEVRAGGPEYADPGHRTSLWLQHDLGHYQ